MIDVLQVGQYKLIDMLGWLIYYHTNQKLYDDYFKDDVVNIEYVDEEDESGWTLDEDGEMKNCIISADEYSFFERVIEEEEDTEPLETKHLWDGKSKPEVGQWVRVTHLTERLCKISYIGSSDSVCSYSYYVIEYIEHETLIPNVVSWLDISSAVPPKLEKYLSDVLQSWKRKDINNAHDDKHSSCHFETLVNICWDVMETLNDD